MIPTTILALWFGINALMSAYYLGVGKKTFARKDFAFTLLIEIVLFIGVVTQ